MRTAIAALIALGMAACSDNNLISDTPALTTQAAAAPDVSDIPAGAYTLDLSHASLVFRVKHMGFSYYTAQFKDFSVGLELDPRAPAAASVTATINVASLDLTGAPEGFLEDLLGPQWLNAGEHPQMVFRSTDIALTGPLTARITGDLTLNGVTKPVTMEARYNGGYAGQTMDPQARIGFSVSGVLSRSDFGIDIGVPTPPSEMGVADDVRFQIEAEMLGPEWKDGAG